MYKYLLEAERLRILFVEGESVCVPLPFNFFFFDSDIHHGELPEHRLLFSERSEGASFDDPDRHVQLQQPQQQAHPPCLLPDQSLLWQGDDGHLFAKY